MGDSGSTRNRWVSRMLAYERFQREYFNADAVCAEEHLIQVLGSHDEDRRLDWLCDVLDLSPGARVLDVGSGVGEVSIPLKARGYDITAIDFSIESLKAQQCQAHRTGQPCKFVCANALALPFRGEFDAAISRNLLHHIAEPTRALRSMTESVRGGGR